MENDRAKQSQRSKELSPEYVSMVEQFFPQFGSEGTVPPDCNTKDFYSRLLRGTLNLHTIQPGKISCFLTVTPTITVFQYLLCSFPMSDVSAALKSPQYTNNMANISGTGLEESVMSNLSKDFLNICFLRQSYKSL
ncbi:hypothetical protein LIER_19209 [Lithospermum erythrorhizon]|uniref:Uncharacterized protein n=1 Tax=Lithospermum erythrorhizon TaxID=34254 RepID=A0AAV3QGW5_LITER